MDYRRVGSFRQRARNAERTTRQMKEHRLHCAAARTHDAIKEFEEHLRKTQESAVDDLPMDAEAGHLREHSRRFTYDKSDKAFASDSSLGRRRGLIEAHPKDNCSDGTSSVAGMTQTMTQMMQTRSQPELSRSDCRHGPGPDVDTRYDQRPPSPLGFYDYGVISSRPRSILAQRSKEAGEPARPAYRHNSVGFYFPGAEFRQGPYGFSMLDPIHMMPKSWAPPKMTPHRWPRDPGDMRPATTEGQSHRHRRSRTGGASSSDIVRSTGAHDRRTALAFHAADKANEELQLERVRFEQGVFEGRWRDPLHDPVVSMHALGPAHPSRVDFLADEVSDDRPRAKKAASKLLFGVEVALRESRGNLRRLFASVNSGTPGVLEPHEFLRALVKVGVLEEDELTPEGIIEAMAYVDPSFDGRINFTMLEHAVAAARDVHRQRLRDAERQAQHRVHRLTNSYHDSLPVDVVKVERQPKSLFDFERAFERFRKQQRDLLAHHGETHQAETQQ
mmetsp:Transcript_72901/g.204757  ORF Transcript_72901/g.204757 Transcript_72901/m.204757 type:complete len:503 (+) Transcript_72901:45-1553(+)